MTCLCHSARDATTGERGHRPRFLSCARLLVLTSRRTRRRPSSDGSSTRRCAPRSKRGPALRETRRAGGSTRGSSDAPGTSGRGREGRRRRRCQPPRRFIAASASSLESYGPSSHSLGLSAFTTHHFLCFPLRTRYATSSPSEDRRRRLRRPAIGRSRRAGTRTRHRWPSGHRIRPVGTDGTAHRQYSARPESNVSDPGRRTSVSGA